MRLIVVSLELVAGESDRDGEASDWENTGVHMIGNGPLPQTNMCHAEVENLFGSSDL